MKNLPYRKLKAIIPGIIGAAVGVGVITQNYIIPLVFIIAGIIVLYISKTRSKEIIDDERTYKIGSYAARYTIAIFSLGALVISLILLALRTSDVMWAVGQTLSYAICAILLVYVLAYKYFSSKM